MHTFVDISHLTNEEQELIRAAARNQGILEIVTRAGAHGSAVVAGPKKFFDHTDRTVAEHYVSLLQLLKEMELIHEVANKNAYELTNFGWQFSRKLGR